MDRNKIELMVKLHPALSADSYAESVAKILTPPKWYQPIQRYKFMKDFNYRVHVVLIEYAQKLINELTK